MERMVDANINKEVLTNQDETPLILVLKTWKDETKVMEMLDLGFSPLGTDRSGMTALSYACAYGYEKLVKRLLSNYDFDINQTSRDGKTPLAYACNKPQYGRINLGIIEVLFSKGADPNIKDNYGRIALDIALLYKDIPITECLIEHGSEVNNIDSQGNTPLLSAVVSRNLEMVKLLLDKGADKTIETSRNIVELTKDLKLNEILELIK